jgi:YbbR domain-containing protein
MINVDVYLDADGVSVKEKDVKKTEIYVDTVKAIELPIEIKTNGMPKEGFLAGTGNGSAEKIVVKGPGGIINKIASASASVDVSGATENINVLSSVELFDYSGNIISDEYLSLSADDVTISISILKEQELRVVPLYSQDYDLSKYEIEVTPATVMAKTDSAFSGEIHTLPITINEKSGKDFVEEVQLDIPATVEIKEIPDKISVEFKIK